MPIEVTYSIRWRTVNFKRQEIQATTNNNNTPDETFDSVAERARYAAHEGAKLIGWTPRRWYQIYRWFE